MTAKLTRRQQSFLLQFLDVYREVKEPVHYIVLAERLGIGKVTAYEMLRLLEERGLVQSEYYLPDQGRGPGRSSVYFCPTALADQVACDLGGTSLEDDSWDVMKERMLEQLRQCKEGSYEAMLESLVAHLPEQQSTLMYLTEMTTATLLALNQLKDAMDIRELSNRLRQIGMPGEIGLSAMAGISAAVSVMQRANRQWSAVLLNQSGWYQTLLSQLGEENCRRLGAFTRQAADILSS